MVVGLETDWEVSVQAAHHLLRYVVMAVEQEAVLASRSHLRSRCFAGSSSQVRSAVVVEVLSLLSPSSLPLRQL